MPPCSASRPSAGTLMASAKVAGGLGVIPSRIAAGGALVVDGRSAQSEIETRMATAHRPYHAAIESGAERGAGGARRRDPDRLPFDAAAPGPGLAAAACGGRPTRPLRRLAICRDRDRRGEARRRPGGVQPSLCRRPHPRSARTIRGGGGTRSKSRSIAASISMQRSANQLRGSPAHAASSPRSPPRCAPKRADICWPPSNEVRKIPAYPHSHTTKRTSSVSRWFSVQFRRCTVRVGRRAPRGRTTWWTSLLMPPGA